LKIPKLSRKKVKFEPKRRAASMEAALEKMD
jgi:hypothetical protein